MTSPNNGTRAGSPIRRPTEQPAEDPTCLAFEQTSSGVSASAATSAESLVSSSAGPSIAELRRLSGLTWEQLARVCGVSRRTLHSWASGKPMTTANERHLQRVLAVVRTIDRGSIAENRRLLLDGGRSRSIPLELLAARRYDEVVALVQAGAVVPAPRPKAPPEVLARRAPRPPAELVGAMEDRIHPASGKLRSSKPVRRAPRS